MQSDGREYHYQGDVVYFKAIGQPLKIYEIQHDEGRVVSDGSSLVYEYGYYDHLGNLRVSYIDSAGVAVISQQNDYDPWGVPLLGLNRASRFANANFYTFNGQEQLDFGYQNMGWRWMDNLTGRMNGIDPMHQFDSGYTGLGNNPVARIDPDGRIAPLVIAGAALVGGAINLASNWSKVKGDWRAGTAYFLSGAVGGVVGLSNVYAGGGITSGANAAIDIATGNVPQLNSVADKAAYVAQGAIIGLGTAVVGAEAPSKP
ncbi:MAG: hypothetical protein EAY79_05185 [Runella slithyformis]|nr:MAG: hypothetical protein EAY79_05185 [Runella slithyformis]